MSEMEAPRVYTVSSCAFSEHVLLLPGGHACPAGSPRHVSLSDPSLGSSLGTLPSLTSPGRCSSQSALFTVIRALAIKIRVIDIY